MEVVVLKSCPKAFNHAGNTYRLGKIIEGDLLRLAKDPNFKHIVLKPKATPAEKTPGKAKK